MFELIKNRYANKKTGSGHDLRVDPYHEGADLWFLHWDEERGADSHDHMGIARIHTEGNTYVVGWFRGVEQEPYQEQEFPGEDEMFSALDEEIAKR